MFSKRDAASKAREMAPKIRLQAGVLLAFLLISRLTWAAGAEPAADWAKHKWLEKAARVLRDGHGLSANDDVAALLKLPEGQIVDQLMADPRFNDTVFDFNTYFLGFKMNSLHEGKGYTALAFEYPAAITSAREVAKDGDYFKLFDFTGSIYIAPLVTPKPNYPPDPAEKSLKPEQIRAYREVALQKDLRSLIDFASSTSATSSEICSRFAEHLKHAQRTNTYLRWPKLLMISGPTRNPTWYPKMQALCALPSTVAELKEKLKDIYERNEKFFAELAKFEPAVYQPTGVSDFQFFNIGTEGLSSLPQFGSEEIMALSNSSTNLDRKRASYVLSRFFCDDLTPIGVEDPGQHSGADRHASEPSCLACHYKLDPMAGFFRDYGLVFLNYKNLKQIIFDDMAKADLAHYEGNWRAPKTSAREWNIGYVRSPTEESKNSYGESLEDLSRIVREAPEAKRCVAKRLFEYFVDRGQTLDAGYLNSLTEQFTDEAKLNSSRALKSVVKRLVLSKSFARENPDSGQCYDFAPDEDPSKSPPCRVSYLLEQNCRQCHSSTNTRGGLDLTHWVALADGTKTFPHLDAHGDQIAARDNLNEIIDRLSTGDANKRMPKKKLMTSQERQELYLWAEGELGQLPTQNSVVIQ